MLVNISWKENIVWICLLHVELCTACLFWTFSLRSSIGLVDAGRSITDEDGSWFAFAATPRSAVTPPASSETVLISSVDATGISLGVRSWLLLIIRTIIIFHHTAWPPKPQRCLKKRHYLYLWVCYRHGQHQHYSLRCFFIDQISSSFKSSKCSTSSSSSIGSLYTTMFLHNQRKTHWITGGNTAIKTEVIMPLEPQK